MWRLFWNTFYKITYIPIVTHFQLTFHRYVRSAACSPPRWRLEIFDGTNEVRSIPSKLRTEMHTVDGRCSVAWNDDVRIHGMSPFQNWRTIPVRCNTTVESDVVGFQVAVVVNQDAAEADVGTADRRRFWMKLLIVNRK